MGNNSSTKTIIDTMQQRIEATSQEIADLTAKIEEIKSQVEHLQQEPQLKVVREEYHNFSGQLDDLRVVQKPPDLLEKIHEVGRTLEAALATRKKLIEEYYHLRENAGLDLASIQFSEHILRTWGFESEEYATAFSALTEINSQINQLQAEIQMKTASTQISQQHLKISSLNLEIERLQVLKLYSSDQLQKLEQESGVQAEIAQAKLDKVRGKHNRLSQEIQEVEEEIQRLEEVKGNKGNNEEEENRRLVEQYQGLKKRNQELTERLEAIRES